MRIRNLLSNGSLTTLPESIRPSQLEDDIVR
jgi:hypothetical protein